ncbi:broad-complex core protein isoforms 1/2/3/4/5-like isoform X3 [Eriocheir sinensis]|uniref:broad-complex core protein isoforms 1/2/3/4/5-like isoform X3 n=1 Tax=Eriocheir sinensis TaxID=95602 RepID=UPI0021C5DA8C|nr:broad-complex core protein isoforms 1/2/3/4/5-like isoform X3 [Eriocheir sinensis]
MGADQQFCLRWNNFHSNITSAFESLRDDEDFVDITLACEGRQIKAHKMVLSACSPYFRSLLKGNPCQHPIVFLKDVTFANLTSILDFMYHGEVNVSHNELATFLKTAEALKVRGLAEDEKKKDAEGYNESSSPPPSRGEPPDPGSSPRPEEGGSAPDTHLSGDSPQPPPSKRQRRRSAASLHSAEDNTSETVLSEGQRDSSASVKNEPQDYPEDEDNMLASSAPATLEPQDLIKADLEDPDDRSFGPSDSVTISRSQAAMQQLQESFGSFLPGMGQAPSGFLPQGATDLPRPPPYPLEGVQGLPPGISALPGPSMSQGASQETGQGGGLERLADAVAAMVGVVYEAGPPACDVPPHPPTSEHPGYLAPPAPPPPTPSTQPTYHCEPTPTTLALGFPPAHRGRPPTGEEVACGVCGKVLCNKYVLKIHVRDMHGPRQSHQCPVCRRLYASLNSLRAHMSGTHKKTPHAHAAQHPHPLPHPQQQQQVHQQQQQQPLPPPPQPPPPPHF